MSIDPFANFFNATSLACGLHLADISFTFRFPIYFNKRHNRCVPSFVLVKHKTRFHWKWDIKWDIMRGLVSLWQRTNDSFSSKGVVNFPTNESDTCSCITEFSKVSLLSPPPRFSTMLVKSLGWNRWSFSRVSGFWDSVAENNSFWYAFMCTLCQWRVKGILFQGLAIPGTGWWLQNLLSSLLSQSPSWSSSVLSASSTTRNWSWEMSNPSVFSKWSISRPGVAMMMSWGELSFPVTPANIHIKIMVSWILR